MLAQLETFWAKDSGTTNLYLWIGIGFLLGVTFMVGCMKAPIRSRRVILASVAFFGGLFWVLYHFWPKPAFRGPNDLPVGITEDVGFWLSDAVPIVGNFANIISGFILGLGVYSLGRIHFKRITSGHKDAFFSGLLIVAMVVMFVVCVWDWNLRTFHDPDGKMDNMVNWGMLQYTRDVLFDGLYMVMDGTMFSMIAFFILSAAYRAFRLRSVEATILLATALVLMLSLMGALVVKSNDVVDSVAKSIGQDPSGFMFNLRPSSVKEWIVTFVQTPSIRAVDLGLGVGLLAMGLRLWLSLEKGVSRS